MISLGQAAAPAAAQNVVVEVQGASTYRFYLYSPDAAPMAPQSVAATPASPPATTPQMAQSAVASDAVPASAGTPATAQFAPVSGADPAATQSALGIASEGTPVRGILSEVRLGVLKHDVGLISSATEEGYDGNFELLFASPDFLDIVFAPRPHIGAAINSSGDTSQGYAGLSWTVDFFDGVFGELSVGGAVHDGDLANNNDTQNEFGCRILFRESLSLGYRFDEHHSISAMFDHISNAGFCDENDGMDNAGIRYGYRF